MSEHSQTWRNVGESPLRHILRFWELSVHILIFILNIWSLSKTHSRLFFSINFLWLETNSVNLRINPFTEQTFLLWQSLSCILPKLVTSYTELCWRWKWLTQRKKKWEKIEQWAAFFMYFHDGTHML